MTDYLWSDTEWTTRKLEKVTQEIEKIASNEMGLDPYPIQIEIITSEQMVDSYSSIGLPIFYKHWSFGKSFTQNWDSYQKGIQGLAYEIVINSNPCISYLMEENTMTMQALVISHAAFGHSHFFKHNYLFKQWTDAESIIDYLIFARDYIAKCEVSEGQATVESFLDSCHVLMNYGVNRYKRPGRLSLAKERARQEIRDNYAQSQVSELFDTLIKQQKEDPNKVKNFPAQPEENILYFCEKFAPDLPEWKREIIRIVRKISEYFYPQGQCLVGNTYVYTRNGIEMLSDVIKDEGYNTHKMDLLSLDNRFEETSHAYKHKVNRTVRIRTRLGRVLEGTLEHPVMTLQPDLQFTMIKLGDIVVGTPLVMKLGYNRAFAKQPANLSGFRPVVHEGTIPCQVCGKAFGNLSTHIPTHMIAIAEYRDQYGETSPLIAPALLYDRSCYMKTPLMMSPEFARLLGYLVSEGSISESGVWSFPNTDETLILDALTTLQNKFELVVEATTAFRTDRLPIHQIAICNSKFREFLQFCGMQDNVRSATQQIPWVILQSDRSIVREFLSALFEGDGCNTASGSIQYTSASRALCEQIQLILSHFGVGSRVTEINNGSHFKLAIISDFHDLFLDQIGFLSERKKQATRDSIIVSSPDCRVPYVKNYLDNIRHKIDAMPSKSKTLRRESLPYTSSTEFSRYKVNLLLEQFENIKTIDENAYAVVKQAISSENLYDEVISVEMVNEEKYVYDVTVPSNHLFMSDCYVSHNTKVCNEGCATYVHHRIMNRLYEKGLVTDGSMIEFMTSHTNVVFQPEFDDPRYSGINPYALGFAMMKDIERICREPTPEDRRWFPDIAGCNDEMTVLRDAWANYRDESFVRQFLSPKVIRDFKLFQLSDKKDDPHYVVQAIHDDRGYEKVRESLADSYERHASIPQIEVMKVDPQTRTLTLHYNKFRGRTLGKTTVLIKHIQALWGHTVNLRDEADNLIA